MNDGRRLDEARTYAFYGSSSMIRKHISKDIEASNEIARC